MKFGKRDKSIVDALFLLALFGVFLICALFIVLFGAKIYKNTVKSSEDSFFSRTCTTYITEKIRQNDNSKGIIISENNGQAVIELTKTVNDKDYVTYIFVDDGYLKEYTTSAGNDYNADTATRIIELKSMDVIKCSDSLYDFYMVNKDGVESSFYVSVSSDVSGSDMSSRTSGTDKANMDKSADKAGKANNLENTGGGADE